MKAVQTKRMKFKQASERFNVPGSVICTRIKWRVTTKESLGAGRSTALSKDVEKAIVQCIQARAEMGYPVDEMELLEMVQDYVCQQNIKTPFKNGRPDEDWYNGFMKRAAVLSLKKPELLQKSRKMNRKPDIVFNLYEILERVMDENSLKDDSKAAFVFNWDESGFNSDLKNVRAIGVKGKPLNRVSSGSGKQSTTVLACISCISRWQSTTTINCF